MNKRKIQFVNRQTIWITLLLLCLLLSGCSQNMIPDIPCKDPKSSEASVTADDSGEAEKTKIKETHDPFVSVDSSEKVTSSDLKTKAADTPQKNNKKEPLPTNSAEIVASIPESVQEEGPSVILATEKDCKAVAEQTVRYLNEYRKEQGVLPATILDKYIHYAEYRSRQLISHFAHDTMDEREAATALQIGTYVDPADYGMDGDPYYTADVREAIGYSGFVGTVEEVARNLADMVRDSPAHWAYVGGAEYTGIAVGITYTSDLWYVDIAMKN